MVFISTLLETQGNTLHRYKRAFLSTNFPSSCDLLLGSWHWHWTASAAETLNPYYYICNLTVFPRVCFQFSSRLWSFHRETWQHRWTEESIYIPQLFCNTAHLYCRLREQREKHFSLSFSADRKTIQNEMEFHPRETEMIVC